MFNKCCGSLLMLLLSLTVLPATAAQNCSNNITVTAPNSRYIDPGAGQVQCWGANDYGQLGNGTATESHTPVTASGIRTDTKLGAGNSHSCALLYDGTVQCWGWNGNGQLGNGSTTDSFTPVDVSGLSGVSSLAVGNEHSCARLSNGTVQCWGLNSDGQLGDGDRIDSSTPVTVSGITTAVAVAAGGSHSCALLADGTVQCWGLNDNGQLGNGRLVSALVPDTVLGISTATAIAAGGSHSCARLSSGKVQCWGLNTSGQLGNSTTTPQFNTPVDVSGIGTATAVAAGAAHTCALLIDGTLRCWGLNADGQLGNGVTINSTSPVTVTGITTATEIAAGGDHNCARLSDGKVECWGLNANGQLGKGNTSNSSVPVFVSGISNAAAIAAGNLHSCARLSIGTGTVLDTNTGLMWKRCSEGQTWDIINEVCVGNAKTFTWQEALQRAKDVDLGSIGESLGFGDWRLPNRNELTSLVEHQCNSPAINSTLFPSTGAAPYWSSSPNAGDPLNAWYVDFSDGRVNGAPKTDGSYARLIRGGQ